MLDCTLGFTSILVLFSILAQSLIYYARGMPLHIEALS